MSLSRRDVLTLSAALLVLPAIAHADLAPDDQERVDRAIAYLQGIGNAKGRFSQTDPQGNVTEGTLYVSRPGKARFEYDPPYGLLITSDGKTVIQTNPRLHNFSKAPMSATPLALFLNSQIQLDRGVKVLGVGRTVGGFTITAVDSRRQAQGQITLGFAENPLRLTGWAISDPQRKVTRVDLSSFAPTGALDPSLFVQNPVPVQP